MAEKRRESRLIGPVDEGLETRHIIDDCKAKSSKASRTLSGEKEMVENGSGGGIETQWCWWWATASMAQLGWGVSAFKRGYAGDSRLMPLKAFAVASLFVGSVASASIASLQASGIHKVQDFIELGANIKTGLGVPPRVAKEKADDR